MRSFDVGVFVSSDEAESVLEDNIRILKCAKEYKVNYILIDDKYEVNVEF